MARRGHSTTIGKFAKLHHDRRVSEIRVLGELLRRERRAVPIGPPARDVWPDRPDPSHPDD
ncbi:hypothetical protein [Dactylosporangium sp. NPDC048998]|uniref:hypothetical protein n=1 Tax=Dactylosporangium sp. NPDC048998 TaxID=3363976 RepID=UPI0037249F50